MEFKHIADIKLFQFIINTLQNNLPASAVVLNVSCGNGIIYRSNGARGFNIYGIDVSAKAISKAKVLNKYSHVNFDVVSVEQLIADGKKYNAIICSEVLNHINKPGVLLKTLDE
jgi:2-polyprenyl-3-methyl-5-hydroxy-6-metoxy-1,4-benzoquinol methylase